jgi:hypothetical protein
MTALTENQKLADELGANALRTYRKHYSASTIYPQLVEHMERVVAQRAETASSLVANT